MSKVYLDGMDWVAAWMNHVSRVSPEKGDFFSIVMEPDNTIPVSELLQRLTRRIEPCLPVLEGYVSRDWTLAPCWRYGKKHHPFTVSVKENTPLEEAVFLPLAGNFRCQWLKGEKESLVFSFSHLLFDGSGAELFLSELLQEKELSPALFQAPGYSHPLLNEWPAQFRGGKKIQHLAHEFAGTDILTLPFLPVQAGKMQFRKIELSGEETKVLKQRIEKECGPFSFSFRILAESLLLFASLFPEEERRNERITAAVSVNMRGTKCVPENPFFFNQWSFLPVTAENTDLQTEKTAFSCVRKNYMHLLGAGIQEAFRMAVRLVRIAPLSVMDRMFQKQNGRTGSMMFSYMDSLPLPGIGRVWHLPVIPPVSGLACIPGLYNGKLTVTLLSRKGIIDEKQMDQLTEKFSKFLRREL